MRTYTHKQVCLIFITISVLNFSHSDKHLFIIISKKIIAVCFKEFLMSTP